MILRHPHTSLCLATSRSWTGAGPGGLVPCPLSRTARGRSRCLRAFTLIEILLAVVIFGIVLVAVHSVFHIALRLRNRTVESIESTLPLQRTLTILRRDFAGIVPPGGTFGGPLETSPSDPAVGLSSTPLLQFHTDVGILSDTLPWGDIQKVAYLLAAPTNNAPDGMDLVRAVTRNLLSVSQEEIEYQRLLSGVESITFSFHDGSSWLSTWDSTNETLLLPRAIKAEIQLVSPKQPGVVVRPEPVELVVGLLIQPVTNAASSTATTSTNQTRPPGGGS